MMPPAQTISHTATQQFMTFTDYNCVSFYNQHHETVDALGGPSCLVREQQRMYNYGEELLQTLIESAREM